VERRQRRVIRPIERRQRQYSGFRLAAAENPSGSGKMKPKMWKELDTMMRRDDTAPDANPATSWRILKEGACHVGDFFHSFCRQSANRFAAGVHTFDKPAAELFRLCSMISIGHRRHCGSCSP
jgi:hypothetical protein